MFHGMHVANSLIRAEVLLDGARPLAFFTRPGDGRFFVAGQPEHAYAVRVTNVSGQPIEVICSVDGRDTEENEIADRKVSKGVKIHQGRSHDFVGWRVSPTDVSAFVFGNPTGSIASLVTGTTSNTGVIGLAVYSRYSGYTGYGHGYRNPRAGLLGFDEIVKGGQPRGTLSANEPGDLGTQAGEIIPDFDVSGVHSGRRGDPTVTTIGYATAEWLDRQGILTPPDPQPFPGRPTGYGTVIGKLDPSVINQLRRS